MEEWVVHWVKEQVEEERLSEDEEHWGKQKVVSLTNP